MEFKLPTVEPKLTKEFLLSKNSEETYMRTYLGIPISTKLVVSPLRSDHKPTASFYRNRNKELIFHDFGTGFHANFIGIVMEIHHCDYKKALRIIAEDFKLVEKTEDRPEIKIKKTEIKIEEKLDTILQIQDQPFTNNELKWWESYGVHESTLKKFKVHSCASFFINGNYAGSSTDRSYIFGYYGGMKKGNELWRLYFPQKRTYRFLSNWEKNMIQGAKQLPETGDLLVISKALKDVMCLYELGIPAIAPCSEVLFISEPQLERIKQRFKTIVVFYDNDATGIAFMKKIKKAHPELRYFFIPKKYKAKDLTDFVRKYGIEKTKQYTKQLKDYFIQESNRV
jgi:5S rRNA maturation endonuclease (ribonuclease M5)